jgi:hypothetical protein
MNDLSGSLFSKLEQTSVTIPATAPAALGAAVARRRPTRREKEVCKEEVEEEGAQWSDRGSHAVCQSTAGWSETDWFSNYSAGTRPNRSDVTGPLAVLAVGSLLRDYGRVSGSFPRWCSVVVVLQKARRIVPSHGGRELNGREER